MGGYLAISVWSTLTQITISTISMENDYIEGAWFTHAEGQGGIHYSPRR